MSSKSEPNIFEVDGIVYASVPTDDMKVVSARDVGDYIILVTFSTGETRLVDCTELFAPPPVHATDAV